MGDLEIKRAMDVADIEVVEALLDAAREVDGRAPLSDHLQLDLESGGSNGFAGLLKWRRDGRQIEAYAQISGGNESSALEIVVHPDARSEATDTSAELIAEAIGVLANDGGGILNWWIAEPGAVHEALAAESGMTLDRTLLQMRRPLPAGADVTVATRSFLPGVDDDQWLQVNNRAFAEHGEQGGWTLETLHQRENEAWFDPDGFRIHERDDRIAAFCWTKVHPAAGPDDSELGEIYVIAVDPDFHGLGLGTQLTLAGLDHLAQRGIRTGLLYVDAANTTAVGMYERLGFETHSTNAAYCIAVGSAAADSDYSDDADYSGGAPPVGAGP